MIASKNGPQYKRGRRRWRNGNCTTITIVNLYGLFVAPCGQRDEESVETSSHAVPLANVNQMERQPTFAMWTCTWREILYFNCRSPQQIFWFSHRLVPVKIHVAVQRLWYIPTVPIKMLWWNTPAAASLQKLQWPRDETDKLNWIEILLEIGSLLLYEVSWNKLLLPRSSSIFWWSKISTDWLLLSPLVFKLSFLSSHRKSRPAKKNSFGFFGCLWSAAQQSMKGHQKPATSSTDKFHSKQKKI